MEERNELHVVVGGSGATGRVVARELAVRGKRVRAVNRGGRAPVPEGVEVLTADATDLESMREACRGAAVVYHCAMPPFRRWTELFPPMMEAVIEGAASAGAKLVFADDTWMFGKPDGPMTEDLPYRPVSNKGVLRAWLAEMLLRAHDRGRVRGAIGRAGELYGPAVASVLGRNLFGAALKGKKARFIGDPDQPLTPTFAEDFARALIVLSQHDEALGEAWHVPTAQPTTGREFVRMIYEECGEDAKVGAVGSRVAKALGLLWPLAREGAEMVYQFERPFVVDSGKYASAFGGSGATPYRDGIRRTVDWYRRGSSSAEPPRISTVAHRSRPEKAATSTSSGTMARRASRCGAAVGIQREWRPDE
jgi:nucleoside-diphosphate-sugar epimerase